ncbi:hypothetical protein GCM10020218_103250 [Dactylosporangium vinaceum]
MADCCARFEGADSSSDEITMRDRLTDGLENATTIGMKVRSARGAEARCYSPRRAAPLPVCTWGVNETRCHLSDREITAGSVAAPPQRKRFPISVRIPVAHLVWNTSSDFVSGLSVGSRVNARRN